MKRIAVFASGRGSNLQSILDWFPVQDDRARVQLVISNKQDAYALERARLAGVEGAYIPWKKNGREAFEQEAQRRLETEGIDLVLLAGFMRISSDAFVDRWRGRIMNVHPSLLPLFPGLHPQQQALDAGAAESGCTVHFVDNVLDGGDPILQKVVPVLPGDTADDLAARILPAEHEAYPQAVRLWLSGLAFPVPSLSEGTAEFGSGFAGVLDHWNGRNFTVAQRQHGVRVARLLRDWGLAPLTLQGLTLEAQPEVALARSADDLRMSFAHPVSLDMRRARWEARDQLTRRAASLGLEAPFLQALQTTAQEWDRTVF